MRKKVNRSELIRAAVAANSGATNQEIVALLKEQKHNVSSTLVSQVRSKRTNSNSNGLGVLFAARDFVQAAGGLKPARECLEALASLTA